MSSPRSHGFPSSIMIFVKFSDMAKAQMWASEGERRRVREQIFSSFKYIDARQCQSHDTRGFIEQKLILSHTLTDIRSTYTQYGL